jgi:hypothetical protein
MRKQAACKISMHGDYIIYNNINVGFIIYKTSWNEATGIYQKKEEEEAAST